MASKEASTTPKEAKPVGEFYAFEFKLEAKTIGLLTTDKQVKAKVSDAFMGYGAFDECRVSGGVGKDRTVTVFFARLFGKGQPAWDAVKAGEKPTVTVYDVATELQATDAKPSGGGAATGTSFKPKKEAKKEAKKSGGRGRGEENKDGKGDAKDGKDGKKAEGKDGGRGRGRGAKKEEVKGPSLQRGRANIGGALGPVSKVRLAKIEKAKKEKDLADRIARGEKIEDPKKEELEDPSKHLVKPKAKEEKGKTEEKGKKGGDAKKEGGKKEAGKAEGKKEAGKAPAKAPAKK
jgi:hypothetical protein